jgi:peptidoglycan/xylan/chitin deacetylase (PgdA/CDA1 family)
VIGPGATLRNRSRRATFLCYHSIAERGPEWLVVSPELFERQLAALRRAGWRTGGLTELAALAEGRKPDRPTAFLTFDDGFLDNYTTAFPLLQAYGATAIVFLLPPSVDVGGPLRWPEVDAEADRHPDVMRSMTWEHVGEMEQAGIGFGSHTLTHPSLPTLDDARLRAELEGARAQMQARLGSCDSLAYPFGHWDARVRAAAQQAGYRLAFTLPPGHQWGATPLSIPRLSVDHRDDGRRFAAKLHPLGRRLLLSPAKEVLRTVRDRGRRPDGTPAQG